jgi:hypothetical protein
MSSPLSPPSLQYDSFVTAPPPSEARLNRFLTTAYALCAPMHFLHSGNDFMPIVQMQKERK